MRSKTMLVITIVLVSLLLLTGACSAGFVAARVITPTSSSTAVDIPILPDLGTSPSSTPQASTPADKEQLFEPFWQAWDLVHQQYVDQPVDDVALMRGAIQGMLAALGDQHTSYLDPAMFEQSNDHLSGESEYEGIGAWVDISGDYLTIISPMPGSPAEEVGLQPGDQVIAVNGEDMTGIDGEAVRQRVIGPEGTTVDLTIRREGTEEPVDVTVRRASIVVPTIEARMLDDNVGYVRLFVFGDKTARDLHNALEDLMDKNPSGLVLDLRYNGGGYLDTAVDVASEFIDSGVILYEEYGDGRRDEFTAKGNGVATEIPLVVLINEGSASASEIVAGAVQASGRGQLVGTTSFGKGSVQVYTPLANDQGAVRVTIARWLTPDGETIHEVGLTPDVVVEISEEDNEANRDPQLDKAIELLTQ